MFVCGFVERGRWRGKARERGFHRLVSFDELWSFGGRWSGDEVYEVRLVSLNESLSRKYSLSTRILLRRTFSFNEHPHQQIFFNEHPHPTIVFQRISSFGSAMVVHQHLVSVYELLYFSFNFDFNPNSDLCQTIIFRKPSSLPNSLFQEICLELTTTCSLMKRPTSELVFRPRGSVDSQNPIVFSDHPFLALDFVFFPGIRCDTLTLNVIDRFRGC